MAISGEEPKFSGGLRIARLTRGRRRYGPLDAAEHLLCVANRHGIDSPQAFNADTVQIVVVKEEHQIASAVATYILKGSCWIAPNLAIAHRPNQLNRWNVLMHGRSVVLRCDVARRLVREVPKERQHLNRCRKMAETPRSTDHQ